MFNFSCARIPYEIVAAVQTRITLVVALCVMVTAVVRADILRWDNGQVIPGTEGIQPSPGVKLDHRELGFAGLQSRDLTDADFSSSNLFRADFTSANLYSAILLNANLTEANLAHVNFSYTTLTNANLTGANLSFSLVGGANEGLKFSECLPITLANEICFKLGFEIQLLSKRRLL